MRIRKPTSNYVPSKPSDWFVIADHKRVVEKEERELINKENALGSLTKKQLEELVRGNITDEIERLFNLLSDPVKFEAAFRHAVISAGQGHLLRSNLPTPPLPVPVSASPTVKLPAVAPALWLKRTNKQQQAPDFIEKTYGQWLGKGLTRAHIHKLDAPLYNALARWLTVNKTLPEGVKLPTQAEWNADSIDPAVEVERAKRHREANRILSKQRRDRARSSIAPT